MRVSLSKNQNLVFSKFLKQYKQALNRVQIKQMMNIQQMQSILGYLGYIDQYISDHSQQLSHSVAYMLSQNKDCIVSKGNLFQFLRIISDIKKFPVVQFCREIKTLANDISKNYAEPIIALRFGKFIENSEWKCSLEEQKQVKKIFGSMNLKRISRQKIEAQKKDNSQFFQEQTFQPQILDKSRNLANQKYKKVSLSKPKVQDRLLVNQSLQKSRLEAQINKSMQKQMKECVFKPKINSNKGSSISKYIDSINTSFENKQNDKSYSNIVSHNTSSQSISKSKASLIGDRLFCKGRQYDQNLEKLKDDYKQLNDFFQMKECTFQPKLYQKAYNNHTKPYSSIISQNSNSSKVRNVDKSIERMKQARKKRQFQNQVKQRGYPQNVAWTKFMNNYKSQSILNTENKSPILCIDLKIMDSTRNIKVYQGQSVEQISEKICVQNSVPHQFWNRVQTLLKYSIQQCNEVKVYQNKIYLNK